MNPFENLKEDINNCIEVLKRGGVILYPTDTIWGLGCDATNASAVEKIYTIKKRTDSKSMLVLLENENHISGYIDEVPEIAWELIDVSDTPLTIIYPGAKNLAKNLMAKDGSVGIRITKENFSSQLIKRFHKPIVSSSSNISGDPSPENFDNISPEIKDAVDFIVKYRQDDITKHRASGIIRLGVGGELEVLRK